MRGRRCECSFLLLLLIAIIVACAPPTYSTSSSVLLGQESSIAYLKGLYVSSPYYITSDITIEGVITANNAYGEFPYSIVIEDDTGAIEIMCDVDYLDSGFAVGATLEVLCSGLWLGSIGGMLSLGDAPYDTYPTSQLSEEKIAQHLYLCDVDHLSLIPIEVTLSEFTTEHILRYVYIKNLQFKESDNVTFCSRNEESGQRENTTHTLVDTSGVEVSLSVSSSVLYADENVPQGLVSLLAIVEYFNGEYLLRIVNCGYLLT